MKEVTSLRSKKVDQETIALLEELLESARAGTLESIMYIDKYADGKIGNGWAGRPCMKMIGEIEGLKFIYLSLLASAE